MDYTFQHIEEIVRLRDERVTHKAALREVVAYIRLQYPGVTMDGSHVPPSAKKLLAKIAAVVAEEP